MQPSDKEIYRLWYSYLQLSDRYLELCELYRKHPNGPPQFVLDARSRGETVHREPFKENMIGGILYTYETFGDVHQVPFDEFWESEKGAFLRSAGSKPFTEIKDTLPFLLKTFELYHPSASADPREYLTQFFAAEGPLVHLSVNILDPVKIIQAEIKALIKKKRELLQISKELKKGFKWSLYCNRRPTPNLLYDEVKRYYVTLRVFKVDRLTGGDAYEKIEKELGSDHKHNANSSYYSDKTKAEKIVQYVEIGYFPGDYYKSKKA